MLNARSTRILNTVFSSKKLSHCYLISSDTEENTLEAVSLVLRVLKGKQYKKLFTENVIDSDVFCLFTGENGNFQKDSFMNVFENLDYASSHEGLKILIIKDFEKVSSLIANSILKSIEEPKSNTLILLTTRKKEAVLPTILSRSVSLRVSGNANSIIQESLSELEVPQEYIDLIKIQTQENKKAIKLTDSKNIEYLQNVYEHLLNSFIDPAPFYVFLNQSLTKEKPEKTKEILKMICQLFLIMKKRPEIEMYKIYGEKINYIAKNKGHILDKLLSFVFELNEFLINIESNLNFALCKEVMLNKLMECYE
ncbi:hypothetical protein [Mycoplasma sp. Ms02]|uniref:hypothetical protein n=1 Tax=Mycoplasma sp. Ms02 TaxID=353851 RepID=UPI001C8A898B|nr:hypothetical protein [Mycoplasma sp. Ms02]QZE12616.1 hypothetical protein K4L35_01360 [Mycoplasma sp. Ms02]